MTTPEPSHIGVAVASHRQAGSAQRRRGRENTWGVLRIFFEKITADWMFTLAGLLAYNFLLALFPLALLLVAVATLSFNHIPGAGVHSLENNITTALSNNIGGAVVAAANDDLHNSAGALLIIGVLTALFLGSRLFVAMQNCFCVIYRARPRSLLQQNVLALTLTIVFVLGGQLLFLASDVPTTIVSLFLSHALDILGPFLTKAIGVFVGFLIALVVFLMIYTLLPNRPTRFAEVWRGAALAAALLVAYLTIFPLYAQLFLRPNAYGAAAGFVILLLFFVYYLSLILLFGAELNAWTSGLRQPTGGFALYLDGQGSETTHQVATTVATRQRPSA